MEHRGVGLVIIGAIHAARTNYADRGAVRLKAADLYGGCVRAQHVRRTFVTFGAVRIERVHFGACWMVPGDIQRVKVIPIGFNLRPFGDAKPHVGKDRCDLFCDLADRVDRSHGATTGWQCHIQPFTAQTFIQRRIGKRGFLGDQRAVNLILERIERGASRLAFLRRHFAQLAHLQADLTLFAKRLHTQLFKAVFITGVGDQLQVF